MKISIITATFNSIRSLPQVLASINSQSHADLEWIVVDGGSRDGTVEFLEANARFIDKMVTEPDKGIYDALNKGLALATGDVIGFLHSDDFLARPDIIQEINARFSDPMIDGVYGDLHYVGSV